MSLVKVESKKEWAVVRINRPKALNALSEDVLKELSATMDELKEDDEVKAIVITGEGRAFVAGADIAAMKPMNCIESKEYSKLAQEIFADIEDCAKPVIAAINGFALGGGCELAMACDIRIASEDAQFGQPEITLGIIPGFCGTQRLPKLVGEAQAKEMIFTGEHISANKALEIGLVNDVVAGDELMDTVEELVAKIVDKSAVTLKLAKEAINTGLEMTIADGSVIERDLFGICFDTGDQTEGMDAFLNKRDPEFKDK
ncbi:enoyl-CoA hydratase-related protein [Halanaerobaculum tunisiense]